MWKSTQLSSLAHACLECLSKHTSLCFKKSSCVGKKHVFKKIIVGVEKQVSVACEERHGDVTKIPALFVFLYSMIFLELLELDELGRLLYLGYLYLRSIANW